ncbi:hypothetical protein [Curtobacterium sp. 24E2]|nr:hypothetical protein JN350_02095 [Curtobacterium sp. 24E2]
MTKPDHDHLDDGVDMTFEERRQDTFRRMSGSDAHDAAPGSRCPAPRTATSASTSPTPQPCAPAVRRAPDPSPRQPVTVGHGMIVPCTSSSAASTAASSRRP